MGHIHEGWCKVMHVMRYTFFLCLYIKFLFEHFFQDLAEQGTLGAWQAVTEVTDLKPGDVLIRDSTNPGHAMIAMGTPESTEDPGKYR